jgi:hypothetical protein
MVLPHEWNNMPVPTLYIGHQRFHGDPCCSGFLGVPWKIKSLIESIPLENFIQNPTHSSQNQIGNYEAFNSVHCWGDSNPEDGGDMFIVSVWTNLLEYSTLLRSSKSRYESHRHENQKLCYLSSYMFKRWDVLRSVSGIERLTERSVK